MSRVHLILGVLMHLHIINCYTIESVDSAPEVDSNDFTYQDTSCIKVREFIEDHFFGGYVQDGVGPYRKLNFDNLPSYVEENSDVSKGFIYLGPAKSKLGHNFMTVGKIDNKELGIPIACGHTYCILQKYWEPKNGKIEFTTISFTNCRYTINKVKFLESELPSLACSMDHHKKAVVAITTRPDGEPLTFIEGSMYPEDLSSMKRNDKYKNITFYSLKTVLSQCKDYKDDSHGFRRLQSVESCAIDISKAKFDKKRELIVSMYGEGVVVVVTDHSSETQYCSHTCHFKIWETENVYVTCPNGFQHKLKVEKKMHEDCIGADLALIGIIFIAICRGTTRPYIFLAFIIWGFVGYALIPVLYLILAFFYRAILRSLSHVTITLRKKLNIKGGRHMNVFDEEAGVCEYCGTMFMSSKLAVLHANCELMQCPYCKKAFEGSDKVKSEKQFRKHCIKCPKYQEAKDRIIFELQKRREKEMDSLPSEGRSSSFSSTLRYFEDATIIAWIHRGTYLIILLILFGFSVAPTNALGQYESLTEDELIKLQIDEKITAEKAMSDMIQSDLNYFSVTDAESVICGIRCWNSPDGCNCGIPDLAKSSNEILKKELGVLREVRKAEEQLNEDSFKDANYGKDGHIHITDRASNSSNLHQSEREETKAPHHRKRHDKNNNEMSRVLGYDSEEDDTSTVTESDNVTLDGSDVFFRRKRSIPGDFAAKSSGHHHRKAKKDGHGKEDKKVENDLSIMDKNLILHSVIDKDWEKGLKFDLSDHKAMYTMGGQGIKCKECLAMNYAHANLNPNIRKEYHSSLQTLEQIQTDWGLIKLPNTLNARNDISNIAVSWETQKTVGKKIIVQGTVTGKLNIGERSGQSWEITSPDSDEKIKLTILIFDAAQVYKLTDKFTTGSRYITKWFRGMCTGDCPDKCACGRHTTCHYKKWDNDRKWTCNPTWCWTVAGGCSCCAADMLTKTPAWLIRKMSATHISSQMIVCLKLGSEKIHCELIKENKAIKFKELQVTFSKPYGEIKHLGEEISVVYNNKAMTLGSLAHPDFIWLDDEICTGECTHGTIGDIKADNPVLFFFESTFLISGREHLSLSWSGVDFEHTCHSGSWPSCEYYNLVEDIDSLIEEQNKTSKHLLNEFKLKKYTGTESGAFIYILPKYQTGMIDYTIQANGVELNKKEYKFKASKFEIKTCKGCFGCKDGFTCQLDVSCGEKVDFNVHLSSKNRFIQFDQNTINLDFKEGNRVIREVHGVSLLNETEIEICIDEDGSCAKKKITLEKPLTKLGRRETVVELNNNDYLNNEKCSGLSWFGCFFSNVGNFFKNIYDWMMYCFQNWWTILILLLVMVGLVVCFYFFGYIKFFFSSRFTSSYHYDPDVGYISKRIRKPVDVASEAKVELGGKHAEAFRSRKGTRNSYYQSSA
ncbi:glycoprotein precursor [Shayang Spider Virus 1]|uniref:Glycoprotein n=1 Tax=Shayang Spider Virus 1 TaxID=1608068 RepID=A0A0B5KTY7_9VIRU|nr:glycoprotein precursor [Shayang Spider Virus 1]AJG39282.1 glycoprotein precursor [Shayang Spider Virus 1]